MNPTAPEFPPPFPPNYPPFWAFQDGWQQPWSNRGRGQRNRSRSSRASSGSRKSRNQRNRENCERLQGGPYQGQVPVGGPTGPGNHNPRYPHNVLDSNVKGTNPCKWQFPSRGRITDVTHHENSDGTVTHHYCVTYTTGQKHGVSFDPKPQRDPKPKKSSLEGVLAKLSL